MSPCADDYQIPAPVCEQVPELDAVLAPTLALELGLTAAEYEQIRHFQGRTPTLTELYIYSLMWSEHCSYKHSRLQLRKFPTSGPAVLQGPGENAGVIRVGDGWAVAFKMESHNHPSAIEPFQGAATGVGGIIRDIFTMGARPIAVLDSLRFGSLAGPRQRYLFEGSVAGIGAYGNCLGVPTVGGEVYFEDAYEGNCLINAMAVGLMPEDMLTRAVGSGPGNLIILLGSTTGRDGIGGASVLASQEFNTGAEAKRPAVQVGDPFEEKLLIEACLELLQRKLLVALGDLGAAGLTSSASEMASRGGVGIDLDVQKVPRREPAMQAFEVMVSESQERMLAVAEPQNLDAILACCAHWGVDASVIGSITDTGRFVVRDSALPADAQIVADMPAQILAESAPVYDPPSQRPAYLDKLAAWDLRGLAHPEGAEELTACLIRLLASQNINSRAWIYRQYDHQVMNNTVIRPGADAAVLRIADTGRDAGLIKGKAGGANAGGNTSGTDTAIAGRRGIALSTDCNGRWCYLDPYRGAQAALAESVRNLACVGATPAAITDCLNFGSPEKPEVFWTFVAAVDGLSEACRFFDIPVVSGNVSFYNESYGKPIYPTPTIGIVGLVDDINKVCTPGFKQVGDVIILVGQTFDELGGSEYLKLEHDLVAGAIPDLDLELERDVCAVVQRAVAAGLLSSAHDLSTGGLAVALAESCMAGGQGAHVVLDSEQPDGPLSNVAALFAESNSRILVSLREANAATFIEQLLAAEVPYSVLGEVSSAAELVIEGLIQAPLAALTDIYERSLQEQVGI